MTQSVHYHQVWVDNIKSAQYDELVAKGYKVYAIDSEHPRRVLLGKRKEGTRLNTDTDYVMRRDIQAKLSAQAEATHARVTKAQRHRERLERQGDRP